MIWRSVYFCTIIILTSGEKIRLPTGWVDPTHQDYDRSTKTVKRVDLGSGNSVNPDYDPISKRSIVIDKNCDKNDMRLVLSYYRRVINLLLDARIIGRNEIDSYDFRLSASISSNQYDVLKKFGNDRNVNLETLHDVDTVLSEIFQKSMSQTFEESFYDWIFYLKNFLSSPLLPVFFVGCLVLIFTYILLNTTFSLVRTVGIMVLVIFGVGYMWTYIELIEEAELTQMSERLQNSELPTSCDPKSMYWWEKIFFKETAGDCDKYIRANYKTVWKTVSPNKVLIKMTGASISDILMYFGTSIIKIIDVTYNELPFPLNIICIVPMMVVMFLLVTMTAFACCGFNFEISVLYNLFNIRYGKEARRSTKAPIRVGPSRLPHREVIEAVEVDRTERLPEVSSTGTSDACSCSLIPKEEKPSKAITKRHGNKNRNGETRTNKRKHGKRVYFYVDDVGSESIGSESVGSESDAEDVSSECDVDLKEKNK